MEINHIPFLDIIDDVTSKFSKIPNKDFISEGEFPIIDQGANLIAGYTNNISVITDFGCPVIVFGDHTRILKYINYPFAIGADGVKVLSVNTEKAYPLYVFYFLKFLKIPNAGYSRHYKFLKEKKIALPKEIDDQKRIAKVLAQCEEAIQKRNDSTDLLEKLLKSTFLEMFGDPVKNEKGWELSKIGIECDVKGGKRIPKGSKLIIENTGFPYIKAGNIKKGKITTTNIEYLTEVLRQKLIRYIVNEGDVCITVVGVNIGDIGIVPKELDKANLTENANKILIKNKKRLDNTFLAYYLMMDYVQSLFASSIRAAGVPKLALFRIENTDLLVPPIDKQKEFKAVIDKIERVNNFFQESLKELENLYGSVSQRAFNGELDLSKVDISDMEDSKKKDLEAVKEDLTEEQFEKLIDSFEHTLPTGEVPSNRETNIRNMSIKQYLGLPDNEETKGIEFSYMDKDFFYQFILTKGFSDRTFTLPELERYASNYILRGTGFEFKYDNWKTIIFRFIGAKQPIIEQVLEEYKEGDKLTKGIKLKLTDEAFKV